MKKKLNILIKRVKKIVKKRRIWPCVAIGSAGGAWRKLPRQKQDRIALSTIFTLLALFFYFFIFKDLPLPTKLSTREIPQTTKIQDRNGKLLYDIYTEQNRTLVKLTDVPLVLRQATVAIEDRDFYRHGGFALQGILRAVREIVLHHRLQGGSTITQQLIKSALLTPERTVQRKIKEAILAYFVEKIYSKDQILEMYLNQVSYGGTAWGVEAASQMYFGKSVKDLNLAESALLAGLPAAPTYYSPFGAHPELGKLRQHEVLRRMVEDGYISSSGAEEAKNQQLTFLPQRTDIKAPHFVMYVKEQLVKKYGEKLVEQGGLRVTTTLDLDLQEFAENVIATEVAKLSSLRVGNGAALVTRPPTGEILAMVGSKDYFGAQAKKEGSAEQSEAGSYFATPFQGNFNVTTALRQPGSAIKPINYAVGFLSGKITPASLFLDIPTCFAVAGQPLYCPQNYDSKFHGPVEMRFALGNSYNLPAVKMLSLNGVEAMIATASAMGITTFKDPSRYGLSLTLGGGEVMMTDMAVAFAVFANTGIKKDLVSILKVEDNRGKVLEEYKDPNFKKELDSLSYPSVLQIDGPRVLPSEVTFLISHILLDNNARSAAFGGESYLVVPGHAVSVKTGTTDDKRDNWTIGYTPNFLLVAWVGNNDNTPMHPWLTSGVTGAAPIWNKIMRFVLKDQPDLWPKKPEGIVGANICALSGKAPGDSNCPTRFEYFINGTVPIEPESLKRQILVEKGTDRQAVLIVDPKGPPIPPENLEIKEKQVVSDPFTPEYCLDCLHEGDKPIIVRP
ncbi:MAG: 1A family penicillin-binding protein [Microgenomates group bacterium LiPW_16]|nr:MAG: 1A family penicillin-binding protein [Microgenomates group bacterium LiPW_16]